MKLPVIIVVSCLEADFPDRVRDEGRPLLCVHDFECLKT